MLYIVVCDIYEMISCMKLCLGEHLTWYIRESVRQLVHYVSM